MTQQKTPRPTIDERNAAPYVGFTAAALRAWRYQGKGPAYIRAGRSVRYTIADLDAWLASHRIEPRVSQLTDRVVTPSR